MCRIFHEDSAVVGILTDAGVVTRDGATRYSTGYRRSGLATSTMAGYRPGDRSLKVCGKGDTERRVTSS